jgi:hypothetical protein
LYCILFDFLCFILPKSSLTQLSLSLVGKVHKCWVFWNKQTVDRANSGLFGQNRR